MMTTEIPRFMPIDKERLNVLAGARGIHADHAVRFRDVDQFLSDFSKVAGDLPSSIYNSSLGLVGSLRCAYGGTADAITLTTGVKLKSIPVGLKVRFRSTLNNTGTATINIDGLGPIACTTVTANALPALYIRVSADTEAIYDGATWVVDRAPQLSSNANGTYIRHNDGFAMAWRAESLTGISISTAAGGANISGAYDYDMPVTFGTIAVAGAFQDGTSAGLNGTWLVGGANSLLEWRIRAMRVAASGSVDVGSFYLFALGRWY